NTWLVSLSLGGNLGSSFSVSASGWIQSDGQFSISVDGHVSLGITGFGIAGDLSGHVSLTKSGTNFVYNAGDVYTLDVSATGSATLTVFGIPIGPITVTVGGKAAFGPGSTTLSLYASGCVPVLGCNGGTIASITIPASIFPTPPPALATLSGGVLQLN